MKIDTEFKSLIPPLTTEEYAGLETSIIQEGCRDALITWQGIIVDGHNRYEICQKHGLSFNTMGMAFENREQAKEWIILNQFGRRNLNAYDRSLLALRLKELFAEKAKVNLKVYGGNQHEPAPCQKSDNIQIDTKKELAKIAGVSHDTIHKVEVIERTAPEEIKQKIKNGNLTINKAYTNIKREEVKAEKKQAEPPKGKYRVIYADPPWSYGDKREQRTGGAEYHYPSMTINELCEMPIKELAEDNAVLFLWVTSPLLEECFDVIRAWGFKYKTSFVWDKIGHNMGHYNSVRHEFLLVCTRGSCLPDNAKLFDSVMTIEKTRTHSEKPEEFRQIIDTLYTHGNKIELFARRPVPGWVVWGNEA